MTIKVNNIPKQSIEIFAKSVRQEIGVTNTLGQKIDITDRNGSQYINVENSVEQKVEIEQDLIIVPVYEDAPLYEGEYEVTPKVTEQTLPTAQKFLERDVTIEKIPYFEVTNNSGGTTASIGEV